GRRGAGPRDRREPLQALVEVASGDDGADRAAVGLGERLAFVRERDEGVEAEGIAERQRRRVAAVAARDERHEPRFGPRRARLEEGAEGDAAEPRSRLRPARDAVDVDRALDAGEGPDLVGRAGPPPDDP